MLETLWQVMEQQFGKSVWPVTGLVVALLLTQLLLLILYLRKSRLFQRFNALFYFSPSAKLLCRPNEKGQPVVMDCNLAACTLFKADSREELLGRTIEELSPLYQPDGHPSAERAAELVKRATNERISSTWQHLDIEGNPIITKVVIIHFNKGSLLDRFASSPAFLVALHDITRQEKDHAALEAERNALQNILWGTAAGTWEWNVQTGETRFNERWAEMVGYHLDELSPTTIDTWMAFCHPDDLPHSEAMLAEHFAGKRDAYDVEVRMRHRDGRWIWVQDRGRVVSYDGTGSPLWMAGTHTEITLRKEAETHADAAMAQTRKHAALVPGMLYQYWQHPDGRTAFPYSSQGIEDIYGVTPEQVKNDASVVFSVIHHDDFDNVATTINASAETLDTWQAIFRVNHPNGDQLWVEGIATPERLDDGSTIWHGYLRDVSDEHSTQLQLEQYRVSLERSNKELEHFAYAASHDLRQPLRMVTSYAQLLERHLGNELDEDATMMLHYMRDGATRMDNMLLSLLDYSRVGRKGQPIQKMPLKEALDEALHFLHPTIEEANAQLTIDQEWPEVYASPDEMTRLFQNLISNALKYRDPKRAVEIGIHITPCEQHWEICINDNGIGIAADQMGRLFKVFQRLHTQEQYEGTGVGLAICRKIVERHGGEITVESGGESQGSRFFFTLPMLIQQDGS
ncbi:PAS domain-containing protein [Vreelandella aquamarina]